MKKGKNRGRKVWKNSNHYHI